jgi:hypothetical protein
LWFSKFWFGRSVYMRSQIAWRTVDYCHL